MAKNVAARVDKDHREALDRMVENDNADSRSEALRQTSQANLAKRGLLNGGDSWVAWAFGELAKISAYAGIGWLMATLFFPIQLRALSVMFFVVALGFIGAERGWVAWQDRKTEQAANEVETA